MSEKFWGALNKGWPAEMLVPTDAEAIHGVKRLWRHVVGKPVGMRVKVVRGKRRTWMWSTSRGGKCLLVAPDFPYPKPGWPAIVHDLSHLIHNRLNRGAKPHDSRQARIERQLQQYVIEKLITQREVN